MTHKDRKSETQKGFEQAGNAGRFRRENTDAEAHRGTTQSHDYKGEAQNVNDDTGRPLNENEISHARNKANEGARQGRSGSSRGRSEKIY